MLSLSLLALSLFVSHVWSIPNPQATEPANGDIEPAATLGPISQLRIVNRKIAPDGFVRSAVLANGVFPAPLIQAKKGDRFSIEVTNQLTDTTMDTVTSIHWHGIFQTGSNYADGVAWVTQCPIKPQKSFLYQFNSGNQTGTYWYHSHYSVQYCDGLRGPLVIYDPDDPHKDLYDVDDANTVITLSDWDHSPGPVLGKSILPVIAASTLINGIGRYFGGPRVPLAVINVRSGLRYRFRVVSISCDPEFDFAIDGHRMSIIEVDGNEVEPVQVDSLPVFAGQRYSVVVAANQPVGNYWIRASSPGGIFFGGLNSAILRYEGAPPSDPTSAAGPNQFIFNEGDLHPLIDPRPPGTPGIGNADVNIQLVPRFNLLSASFEINGVAFADPPIPVLLQILSGNLHPTQLLPKGSVYELPPNKVVELSFPNSIFLLGGPHPIHLHGHSFYVVRHAGSSNTNFVNPVRRDVVSIGDSSDNVTIRFVTDNAGPWILHCHIDFHLRHGFAVVLAEATAKTSAEQVPADWRTLCN